MSQESCKNWKDESRCYDPLRVSSDCFNFLQKETSAVNPFLLQLPSLLLKQIVCIPTEHNCQITLDNIPGFF